MDDKKDGDAAADGDDAEKKDEDAQDENQIDSRAIIEENVDADEEPMEDLGSEAHEEYEQSNAGENNDAEPYDPNDIWQLEVNSKNKVKSIKKLILEKIKLNTKKANILVYKKNST